MRVRESGSNLVHFSRITSTYVEMDSGDSCGSLQALMSKKIEASGVGQGFDYCGKVINPGEDGLHLFYFA